MTHEDGFPKLEAKAFFGLPALPTDQELLEQIQSQSARIEKLERQVKELCEEISYMALVMRVHHNMVDRKKFSKTANRVLTEKELKELSK